MVLGCGQLLQLCVDLLATVPHFICCCLCLGSGCKAFCPTCCCNRTQCIAAPMSYIRNNVVLLVVTFTDMTADSLQPRCVSVAGCMYLLRPSSPSIHIFILYVIISMYVSSFSCRLGVCAPSIPAAVSALLGQDTAAKVPGWVERPVCDVAVALCCTVAYHTRSCVLLARTTVAHHMDGVCSCQMCG
jgi:hypothetical protein